MRVIYLYYNKWKVISEKYKRIFYYDRGILSIWFDWEPASNARRSLNNNNPLAFDSKKFAINLRAVDFKKKKKEKRARKDKKNSIWELSFRWSRLESQSYFLKLIKSFVILFGVWSLVIVSYFSICSLICFMWSATKQNSSTKTNKIFCCVQKMSRRLLSMFQIDLKWLQQSVGGGPRFSDENLNCVNMDYC